MIEITYSISTEKADKFLAGFLVMNPIPTMPDPANPEEQIPVYTPKDWVKMCGKDYFMRIYKNGTKKLAEQAAVIDKDIFS